MRSHGCFGRRDRPVTSSTDYVVFSDESRHTEGRFRSIAAVSLPSNPPSRVVDLTAELGDALECTTKGELKWLNVGRRARTNVPRAIAAIDLFLSHLSQGLRCDVVIWDTTDSRHSVERRDDVANYGRMFFHLHRVLMRRRGPDARWHLRPDKLITIDWATIRDCLNSDGTWKQHSHAVLGEEYRWIVPMVRTFREVDSAATPFVQLADLFAGMATYTRISREVIRKLLAENEDQRDLFPGAPPTESGPTAKDRGRFRVVSHFYHRSKEARLGVSLNGHGYLRTPNPRNPVNFWHYEPQHPGDKAPTKDRGGVLLL